MHNLEGIFSVLFLALVFLVTLSLCHFFLSLLTKSLQLKRVERLLSVSSLTGLVAIHVLGGRMHFSELIGNMLFLTPLAWSPLQASFDTLRVMIDDGNDVPAAFRATTKKLQDVGSVGIRVDNTWIYKSKIQKWVYLCLLPTSRPVILITGTEEFSC